MSKADCDWQVIEKGRTYSILECKICGRETAIGPGERVRPEQFNCPLDVAERVELRDEWLNRDRMHSDQILRDKL